MSPRLAQSSPLVHTVTLEPTLLKFDGEETVEIYTRSLFRTDFAIDDKTWKKLHKVAHNKVGVFDVRQIPGSSCLFQVEFVPELTDTEVANLTNKLFADFKVALGVTQLHLSH